MDWTAFWLRSW